MPFNCKFSFTTIANNYKLSKNAKSYGEGSVFLIKACHWLSAAAKVYRRAKRS